MNLTGLHINGVTRPSPFVAGEEAGMNGAVITIVGVGLISGSFAIAMREKGFAKKIIGVGRSDGSIQKAKELGIIDESLSRSEERRVGKGSRSRCLPFHR